MLSYKLLKFRRILVILILLLIFVLTFSHYNTVIRKPIENVTRDIEYNARETKRLAVVVPFRDRFDELLVFVPHLSEFLKQQHITSFKIYIINQSSRYRFNRGALINIGYLLAENQSDYIAIHDVDLIPLNKNLSYSYPSHGPYHLSAPQYHPQYNYDTYFGGVLLISNDHFQLVNGMSNRYFGWGLEDDEFYTRIKASRLEISRPTNLTTDKTNTFLHFHYSRKRDTFKTGEQKEALRRRDRITGLRDINYSVVSSHNLTVDHQYGCIIFNIELYCDIKQTPWCRNDYARTHKSNKKL